MADDFRQLVKRPSSILCGLLLVAFFAHSRGADSQTNNGEDQTPRAYRLSVAVDEVDLTFHAADANGLPINDLKLNELTLLDNGKTPRRILAFQLLQNFPIRAGILMDASDSMQGHLRGNRAIAIEFALQVLRQQADRAFVADFVRRARMLEPWTSDTAALTAAIRKVSAGAGSLSHGTAIFDTLYHACKYEFGAVDHAASGNFIPLFSDGEDNASAMQMQDAVDACQHANTAIYAFRTEPDVGFSAPGPTTLAELAAQTGGHVFRDNDSDAGILDDLRTIEADLRNEYRIVYKPADLQHDRSFHRVMLVPPERVDRVTIRSGYYAPAH